MQYSVFPPHILLTLFSVPSPTDKAEEWSLIFTVEISQSVQIDFFRTHSVFIMVNVFQWRGSVLHPRSPVFAGAWGLGKGLSLLWAQCSLWGFRAPLWLAITSCPSNKDARWHLEQWVSYAGSLVWHLRWGLVPRGHSLCSPLTSDVCGKQWHLFFLKTPNGCLWVGPLSDPLALPKIISAGSSKPWQSLRGPAKEPGLRGKLKRAVFALFSNVCRSWWSANTVSWIMSCFETSVNSHRGKKGEEKVPALQTLPSCFLLQESFIPHLGFFFLLCFFGARFWFHWKLLMQGNQHRDSSTSHLHTVLEWIWIF